MKLYTLPKCALLCLHQSFIKVFWGGLPLAFKTKKLKARITSTETVFAGAPHYSLTLQ